MPDLTELYIILAPAGGGERAVRLGVLDVGSNTVHLLLIDGHPGARPEPYASHKIPLQLVQ